jgi:hypothetical protein
MFGRKKTSIDHGSGTGCGYVFWVGLGLVVLLTMNGLLVRAFLMRNTDDTMDIRLAQTLQFIMPLAMIALEFWIFDRITRNWERK